MTASRERRGHTRSVAVTPDLAAGRTRLMGRIAAVLYLCSGVIVLATLPFDADGSNRIGLTGVIS